MLTDKELTAVDNWRFSERMPSGASAARELLKRGLAAKGTVLDDGGRESEEFGALGKEAKKSKT